MTHPTASARPPVPAASTERREHRSALESEDGRSIGEMLGAVTTNVSTLMRQEVALAKAELKQSGTRAGKGVGMFAGAAVAGVLFLVFLSVSAIWGLGSYLTVPWAALIVAAVWAVVAAVLALSGKKAMQSIQGVPQTADTLSKVPNAVKGHEEDNR